MWKELNKWNGEISEIIESSETSEKSETVK